MADIQKGLPDPTLFTSNFHERTISRFPHSLYREQPLFLLMKKQLTLDALAMAYWRRKPPIGLLHHSDRGSQYACNEYQKLLNQYGMVASMSRKGDCWDNAPTERFFRSLKSERLVSCRFETRRSAEIEVLDYITYYNFARLHSTLGYQSPMEYEKEQFLKVA